MKKKYIIEHKSSFVTTFIKEKIYQWTQNSFVTTFIEERIKYINEHLTV